MTNARSVAFDCVLGLIVSLWCFYMMTLSRGHLGQLFFLVSVSSLLTGFLYSKPSLQLKSWLCLMAIALLVGFSAIFVRTVFDSGFFATLIQMLVAFAILLVYYAQWNEEGNFNYDGLFNQVWLMFLTALFVSFFVFTAFHTYSLLLQLSASLDLMPLYIAFQSRPAQSFVMGFSLVFSFRLCHEFRSGLLEVKELYLTFLKCFYMAIVIFSVGFLVSWPWLKIDLSQSLSLWAVFLLLHIIGFNAFYQKGHQQTMSASLERGLYWFSVVLFSVLTLCLTIILISSGKTLASQPVSSLMQYGYIWLLILFCYFVAYTGVLIKERQFFAGGIKRVNSKLPLLVALLFLLMPYFAIKDGDHFLGGMRFSGHFDELAMVLISKQS